MKKRMKALEDHVAKLAETNNILSSTVKVLREENQAYRDADDRGDNQSSDDDGHQKDSPMFFSSRKVETAHPLCSTDLFH